MNFLSHLHLADNSHTSLAANLAGDFAKGNIEKYPKHLQQGLWLHRQIDQLTDSHELVKELLAHFPKQHRRVAPILIDLCFDHMLAKYWQEYHHQTLNDFAHKAYDELASCADLPPKLIDILPRMRNENWLQSYQSRDGLNQAITGVAKRFSKPELFNDSHNVIKQLDQEIETAFRMFYPQLMAYTRIWIRKTPAQYRPQVK
ncbi:ACP phosphodiesterase [uncultured Shewanella sp.]|uniref:acyl carrier protein phosphodiesterase n=1 Tax=uncultured Shewanella sp. TaxID=173975 RepID=UPI00260B431B|nr:ACP phosphodiesterase [uncultured Shewanella sp.]